MPRTMPTLGSGLAQRRLPGSPRPPVTGSQAPSRRAPRAPRSLCPVRRCAPRSSPLPGVSLADPGGSWRGGAGVGGAVALPQILLARLLLPPGAGQCPGAPRPLPGDRRIRPAPPDNRSRRSRGAEEMLLTWGGERPRGPYLSLRITRVLRGTSPESAKLLFVRASLGGSARSLPCCPGIHLFSVQSQAVSSRFHFLCPKPSPEGQGDLCPGVGGCVPKIWMRAPVFSAVHSFPS